MLELDDVKNYLDITYDDEDVSKKIADIFTSASVHCRKLIAAAAEDALEPDEEQLIKDCCRYMYNGAFEDFDKNYMPVINGLRAARQVMAAEDEGNGSQE